MKIKVENSNEIQMRMHAKKYEINAQQSKPETIKWWTNNVKEFERKIEKIP